MIVAALSAGILSVSAYLLVRADRLAAFEERAVGSTELAESLARSITESQPDIEADELASRLGGGRFEVVVVGEGSASTRPGLVSDDLPRDPGDARDGFFRTRAEIEEKTTLVLKSTESVGGFDTFYLFPMEGLQSEMSRLAGILARSWFVIVLLSGIVGYAVARSTLKPVARASAAARSLAEGLLETRLPTGRHDEFGDWALSFNEMAEALQQKIEALTAAHAREKRFTSDVAHELRTPLTGLVGSASLIRTQLQTLDPETRWATERMLEQVTRVRTLVEELLEIARLDSGQQDVSLQGVQLEGFLQALVRDRPGRGKVTIRSNVSSIATDPRRLQRIVGNLLENAMTHGEGEVTVEAWVEGGTVFISVEDEGTGISSADAQHVFERFFKADSTRQGGTGLGLAIARDNARLLGGDVRLQSGNSGARFVVSLPFIGIEADTLAV